MNSARTSAMVAHLSSAPVVVLILTRVAAVNVLKQLLGPESPKAAMMMNSNFLRAVYGKDGLRNAFYASESVEVAQMDVCFFAPDLGVQGVPTTEEAGDYFFRKTAISSI